MTKEQDEHAAFEAVYSQALKDSESGTIKDIARLCYHAALSAPRAEAVPQPKFSDPRVQKVYDILCANDEPPEGEHWEGFIARRIVDALDAQPEAVPGDEGLDWFLTNADAETRQRAGLTAQPEAVPQGGQPVLTRDAVYEAVRLAEGLAGSVAMNNAASSEGYRARLRSHLMQFVPDEAVPQGGQGLPHPGSPEASAMMDSVLAEYGWPANTKNAARAGFVAARRMLEAAPQPEQVALTPLTEDQKLDLIQEARWSSDPDFELIDLVEKHHGIGTSTAGGA